MQTLTYSSLLLQLEATQVYKVGYPSDAHPPQTLIAMVMSFNLLNTAIQILLLDGENLAVEVHAVNSNLHEGSQLCCIAEGCSYPIMYVS